MVELGRELGLKDAVFVGHSVSAMIGALASIKAPDLFEALVMVGPSPRYIDDGDYQGGFTEPQIEELLASLDDNHWAGRQRWRRRSWAIPTDLSLGDELTNSFCRTDPEIAKEFARVTFMSDNRADLAKVPRPRSHPPVQGRHHRRRASRRVCPPPPAAQRTDRS